METNFLPGLILAFRKSRRETVQINQGVITFRRIPCSAKGCFLGFLLRPGLAVGSQFTELEGTAGKECPTGLLGVSSPSRLESWVPPAGGWTQASLEAFLSKQPQLTLSCGPLPPPTIHHWYMCSLGRQYLGTQCYLPSALPSTGPAPGLPKQITEA